MDQKAPGPADYGLLAALAALWGGSFILIKLALVAVPPATITAARLAIGAAFLGAVALFRTGRIARDGRTIALILLVGLVGNAAPFGLIAWGEEVVDAGLASILMGIMPIATLVMAHFLSPGETLTLNKFIGVAIGFAGLVVLVGPALLLDLGDDGVRQAAILGAALCYGVSAILTRKLVGEPRLPLGAAILSAGALWMLPVALILERPWTLAFDAGPALAVLVLGLFSTAVAMLLLFQVLDRQGAGFFGQVNYLVPLMGVFWAVTILGETPGVRAWIALALILIGIAVARGRAPNPPGLVATEARASSQSLPTSRETIS